MSPSKKQKKRDKRARSSLRSPRPARTKFIADAMLGSLARKLRALGFDSSYYMEGGDSGIIAAARKEDRTILTADRSLAAFANSRGLRAFLLLGKTDGVQIGEIAHAASLRGLSLVRGDSLCSKCGGELDAVSRKDVSSIVPPLVYLHHRDFYKCVRCGQVYWHGSHWKKLRSLAMRLG